MGRKNYTLRNIGVLLGMTAAGVGLAKGAQRIAGRKEAPNPLEGKRTVLVEDDADAENADGVRGHLEAVGEAACIPTPYEQYGKRALDIALSFGGIVALSPVLLGIAAAIWIDDPGPVFFTQKRIGQNKKYFRVYKFRSMKMCTPHDVPTHMLADPDQYITRVGRFLRAHSLDELPQLFNVLDGSLSLVGPRPGLWNQDKLTAERDKYGVNEHKPGITGWAQIHGRDSISIEEKSLLDGYGVRRSSLLFDFKCLLGTVSKVGHDDTVVEGGTGELERAAGDARKADATSQAAAEAPHRDYAANRTPEELIGHIGFGGPVTVDRSATKRVLITGAGSYIGESFRTYAGEHYPENFHIDTLDLLDEGWREKDFSAYDIVYHVAGIAHADVGHVTDEEKEQYYQVNTDLAALVAQKAKDAGVPLFVFMSSMIIYGDSAPNGTEKVITDSTVPAPASFYGDSKLQADVALRDLADDAFHVYVLRPPMIYGAGSKGNYPMLAKLSKLSPFFPDVVNHRSMLYIGNFCEFLCQIMLVDPKTLPTPDVVLFPQNDEWTVTSEMAEAISFAHRRNLYLLPVPSALSELAGRMSGLYNKVFGNLCYAQELSSYEGIDYCKVGLAESVRETEGV